MDGNVRAIVYSASDFGEKEPGDMTMREAVEWFKNVGRSVPEANFAETKYLNQRWAALCSAIAEREGLPPGFVSYMLNELGISELQMVDRAVVEAEQIVT